jgi:hypothetical protein
MASYIRRRKFLATLGGAVAPGHSRCARRRMPVAIGPASPTIRLGVLAVPTGLLPPPRIEVGLRNSVHISQGVVAS